MLREGFFHGGGARQPGPFLHLDGETGPTPPTRPGEEGPWGPPTREGTPYRVGSRLNECRGRPADPRAETRVEETGVNPPVPVPPLLQGVTKIVVGRAVFPRSGGVARVGRPRPGALPGPLGQVTGVPRGGSGSPFPISDSRSPPLQPPLPRGRPVPSRRVDVWPGRRRRCGTPLARPAVQSPPHFDPSRPEDP